MHACGDYIMSCMYIYSRLVIPYNFIGIIYRRVITFLLTVLLEYFSAYSDCSIGVYKSFCVKGSSIDILYVYIPMHEHQLVKGYTIS